MPHLNSNPTKINSEIIKNFYIPGAEKKLQAGVLAILLGTFGIHKFILGYTQEGLIMLSLSLFTFGYGAFIIAIISIIEGILYLTKSDQDFVNTYVTSKKSWF
ncbi:TM2 domain-containing protein [Nostoc sp. FACHB-152]|nr:TM2 domain-containing protein [Nostoc sp. FACHB-152]MBD2467679.1 TM2 domain-containing protein [Nostoc sp. FACHB-145]